MKRKEVLKARNSSSGRHGKSANLPFDLISGSDAVVARSNHRLTQPSREPKVEHSPYTCACGTSLGRPDRQTPNQRRSSMSSSSPLSIREDLHNFCRYCERLLAGAQGPDHAPFSQDELQMICRYANEVAKLADSQRVQSNGKSGMTME